MKIFLVITLVILIFYPYFISGRKAKFDIFGKSMKFTFDKEYGYIPNLKECRIKASRQYPGGLFKCEGYLLKTLEKFYLHIQLFYRYGTIYRNYLFNYKDTEPCEMLKKKRNIRYANVLVDLVLKGIKTCCPLFNHECPYYPGWYNASGIDINKTISEILPPVVPVGQYKLTTRAYLDGNRTIAQTEAIGIVKANHVDGVTDFSMLNMG